MKAPKVGTPEWDIYMAGAKAEQELTVKGMTNDGKQAYEVAQTLAQQGSSAVFIAQYLALVFTAGKFWERLRLAWRLICPTSLPKVETSWRYFVVGVYPDRDGTVVRWYPVPFVRVSIPLG